MRVQSFLVSASAFITSTTATMQGFNYGANDADGTCRTYDNYYKMFSTQRVLPNAPGFVSARLYTSVQCGTTNSPIEAIKAALDTSTDLLLGVWASSGQEAINNEITALQEAAKTFPQGLKQRVKAISVGSEDLYRASSEGQNNGAGVGADATTILSYIQQVRQALKGTALEGIPVGHVDTLTGWILPENAGVIQAADFLGYNGFPYFDTASGANDANNQAGMFEGGLQKLESVAGDTPVWVTETGFPVRGPTVGQAVPSPENSKVYWDSVGCKSLFGKRNTFWYTLYDANTAQTDMSFAVIEPDGGNPKFSLQCPA